MLEEKIRTEIASSAFVDELTKLGFDESSSYEMLKMAGPFASYGKAMKNAYMDIAHGIKNLNAVRKLKTGKAEKAINWLSRENVTDKARAAERALNQIKRGLTNKALIGTAAATGVVGAAGGIGLHKKRKNQRELMGL